MEQLDLGMGVPADQVKRPIACSSDGWKTFVEAWDGHGIFLRGAVQQYRVRIGVNAF